MPDFECRLKKYRQLKELTQEQLALDRNSTRLNSSHAEISRMPSWA